MRKEYYETADIEIISFSAADVLGVSQDDPDSLPFQDAE